MKAAKDIHYQIQNAYVNSHVAASKIGISDNTLQRITDTVLFVEGERIDVLHEGTSKINIALQLKSKRNVSHGSLYLKYKSALTSTKHALA